LCSSLKADRREPTAYGRRPGPFHEEYSAARGFSVRGRVLPRTEKKAPKKTLNIVLPATERLPVKDLPYHDISQLFLNTAFLRQGLLSAFYPCVFFLN
jgi:hypothetical protein